MRVVGVMEADDGMIPSQLCKGIGTAIDDSCQSMLNGRLVGIQPFKGSIEMPDLLIGEVQLLEDDLLLLVECLALCIHAEDALLQFGTLQQVGVSAGDGNVLGKGHSVVLIFAALVEAALA